MQTLLDDIRHIIARARERVARSVNHELTVAYWHIGQRLVEEEQQGKERAEYGKALIADISAQLTQEFGSGFSPQNLWFMRQFYLAFPILSALRRELTWTHYKALVHLDDPGKRTFYIAEAVKNAWSVRQLERQMNSLLYERLLQCFVLFDIKIDKITHSDLGQLQTYVNYYDRDVKAAFENPTIGVLLCAGKNDVVVRYSLPEDNRQIFASRYQLHLPTEAQLKREVKKEVEKFTEEHPDFE